MRATVAFNDVLGLLPPAQSSKTLGVEAVLVEDLSGGSTDHTVLGMIPVR